MVNNIESLLIASLEVHKDNPEICWKFILTGDFHLATLLNNIFSPRARKIQELLLRCLPTLYPCRLVAIYCPKMVLKMKYMPHKQWNSAIEIFWFHTLRLFFNGPFESSTSITWCLFKPSYMEFVIESRKYDSHVAIWLCKHLWKRYDPLIVLVVADIVFSAYRPLHYEKNIRTYI